MMEARAIAKFVRVSPDRARLVIDEIRGKPVDEALRIVRLAKSKAAQPIRKALESAIANAENNFDLDVDQLVVSQAFIDEGPVLKRMKPRSRGHADVIRRPTSHITVIVSEMEAG